ncbi:MAG: aminotransferase class V-fold PLP-dependent enzyme [Candidatus Nanohaloarchaea archaeon]
MRSQDFPDLDVTYLDSACMSLRPRRVIQKIEEYYREYPVCTGRSAHSLAERASEELETARNRTADLIDAEPGDLMFTSGTTEGINTVARGTCFEKVVVSDREHNSNLVPWQRRDVELSTVSTREGLDLAELESEVSEDVLVSMVHVSNIDGYELPMAEISRVVHENGGYLMIDAAQSIPHQPFSVEELRPDAVAFSGHKMCGPSGTGGLYLSDRMKEKVSPLTTGGGAVRSSTYSSADRREFPHGMEAGLPDVAGFIGMGEAAAYLEEIGMEKIQDHEEELTEEMRSGLEGIDGVETVGLEGTGIVSFKVSGVDNNQVAAMLDRKDVAVRSGMHCVHSWFNSREEKGSVRASLHLYNDEEDVQKLLTEVRRIAQLS